MGQGNNNVNDAQRGGSNDWAGLGEREEGGAWKNSTLRDNPKILAKKIRVTTQ